MLAKLYHYLAPQPCNAMHAASLKMILGGVYTISGLDKWTGLVDWTGGLT